MPLHIDSSVEGAEIFNCRSYRLFAAAALCSMGYCLSLEGNNGAFLSQACSA
jgi:hypothetical protein